MLYNADEYGLNAHEGIQAPYSDDYDYKDDPVAVAKLNSLNRHRKEEIGKVKDFNRHPIAGAAVGGGIGYGIGRHYAKKTPIIAQQRKRKIVGTVLGAAIGAGIGYNVKTKRSQDSIKADIDKINSKYSQKANDFITGQKKYREEHGGYRKRAPRVNPDLSSAPVTPTSPSEPQKSSTVSEAVSKWNQKFGKFFKK